MAKSVLIVDDNQTLRKLLLNFFKGYPEKFDTYEAADGLEAVEKTSELKPDLIVMDLSMPRENGLGASKKIRDMGFLTPIILFTMHGETVTAKQITSAGISAVIAKPDLTALHREVQFLLKDSHSSGGATGSSRSASP